MSLTSYRAAPPRVKKFHVYPFQEMSEIIPLVRVETCSNGHLQRRLSFDHGEDNYPSFVTSCETL